MDKDKQNGEATTFERIVRVTLYPTRILGAVILILSLFLLDAAIIEPRWVHVKSLSLAEDCSHKLVHITDIHYKGGTAYFRRIVRMINEINPDLVCFTGDLVETADMLPEALDILCTINAPVYMIPGNHEYWAHADLDLARTLLTDQGGAFLESETFIHPGNQLQILGDSPIPWDYEQQLAPGRKHIFLTHYPDRAVELKNTSFDVILAGHSHGGQIRLPFVGSILKVGGATKFERGLYETTAGPMYVSPGLGTYFLDLRFLCRPEITVIEL